jgi:tetratricopeptide (TPR) repeat protein
MPTNCSIKEARTLERQGRTAEAEALYRERLQKQPDDLEALEGLAVLVFQQGRADAAVPLFERVVALRPESARSHANLGEALRLLDRFDLALEHLNAAIARDPAFSQAWNSLGLLAFDQGRHEDAATAYRESIRLRPNFAAAYINLGNALQALGRAREAADALRAALVIEPNSPVALINLGHVLCETRDPESLKEAESVCRLAAALAPDLPLAVNTLSKILRLQGRRDGAVACDPRGLSWASGVFIAGQDVGQSPRQPERDNRSPQNGVTAGMRSKRDDAEFHFKRGVAFLREWQRTAAEASFHEALRADPSLATPWVGLSQLQAERGEIDGSCQSARSALAVNPRLAEAHWRLATTLKGRLPDAEVRAIEALIADESLPEGARAFLHFGLASVLDDRGVHSQAAAHLEAAHQLQSRVMAALGKSHDPDADSRFTDQMIAAFNADLLARGRGWVQPDPRPIFVVGLQRSGTTLVEQILASHPQIHGAGELPDVGRIFQALPEIVGAKSRDSFDALWSLDPVSATVAARRLLERLEALAPQTATRVVDKSPDNIRFLGLIALLWPGARVILCTRDLRDIAVSCWLTGFAILWSSNWEHIARRFAVCQRIIEHWRQITAIDWLEVSYEDLVGNLEGNARRLIDFVGLEWNPACLQFHATPRVVRTPSLVQVRQPIHSRSVGRWRNYETSLQPLFRALKRHGVDL